MEYYPRRKRRNRAGLLVDENGVVDGRSRNRGNIEALRRYGYGIKGMPPPNKRRRRSRRNSGRRRSRSLSSGNYYYYTRRPSYYEDEPPLIM